MAILGMWGSKKTKKQKNQDGSYNKGWLHDKVWADFSLFIRMRDCKWVVGGKV